jgi:hypothetical protein
LLWCVRSASSLTNLLLHSSTKKCINLDRRISRCTVPGSRGRMHISISMFSRTF